MDNMLNCPCGAVYDSHGYAQEHKWCCMDNSVLMQTILEVHKEILRRFGHGGASYPHPALQTASMAGVDAQYFHPSTSHTMTYPPAFNTESFMLSEIHALMGRMQNISIAPPNHSTEPWAADGGAAVSHGFRYVQISFSPTGVAADIEFDKFSAQYGLGASYNASTSWSAEGNACAPQDPVPDEDFLYTEGHGNHFDFETSFHSSAVGPDPDPSISVIEHLEQGTFRQKQPVNGKPAEVVFNGGRGVSLDSFDALVDGREPAFQGDASIGEKASIRFEVCTAQGCLVEQDVWAADGTCRQLRQFPKHSTQVRVRHGKGREGRPITRRELARRVFDELRKLMDYAGKCGDPLQHHGSAIDIERVVLLRIDHVSKGSVQPILGIRNNR